ncbi:MAG: hypothetical protein NTW78_06035 [Campylobacterales bacterium]|nr:hypothetical protein [Campylobacterales bacterium]
MPISNLPVYTGIWPNASTQTDEDYANNTFFAHAWIGTTLMPAVNIFIPAFNNMAAAVVTDRDAVLEAKNITLAARDVVVNTASSLPTGVINDSTQTLLDTWSSTKINTRLVLKQDAATAITLAQVQAIALSIKF